MWWMENTGRIMRQVQESGVVFGNIGARRARSQRIEEILRRRRAAGLYTARIWL